MKKIQRNTSFCPSFDDFSAIEMASEGYTDIPVSEASFATLKKNKPIFSHPFIKEDVFENVDALLSAYKSELLLPNEYKNLDIYQYFQNWMNELPKIYQERLQLELYLYEKYELFNLLRALIYFVDTVNKNGGVIGVGRGSSVSSLLLYLIGIHCVDPILYDLDIYEFFKDE